MTNLGLQVPYGDLVAKHGFVTSIDELPALIDTAKSLSDDELAAREAAIISLRKSHFEWDGTPAWLDVELSSCLGAAAADMMRGHDVRVYQSQTPKVTQGSC